MARSLSSARTRVGRPSPLASHCPPVFSDGRAVAPFGRPAPRLVLRRAGPGVARPLFPLPARGWRPSDVTFPTRGAVAGPQATLRRHVSYTWRGRPADAADGWSPHLRCGPSRRPYDSDEAVVAVEIQVNVRGDCAQLWQATHTIDDVHEGGGRRRPPPPLLCSGGHRRRGRWSAVARGARCFFGTPRCPARPPPSRPRSSATRALV